MRCLAFGDLVRRGLHLAGRLDGSAERRLDGQRRSHERGLGEQQRTKLLETFPG